MFINENYLKLQHKLKSDRQVVKVGDDSSGLLLKDNRVFVEQQPSEEQEVATKKYVDDNAGGGGASALNDLSDVTYSSGDLTISSLDKVVSSGDLEIEANSVSFQFKSTEIRTDQPLKIKESANAVSDTAAYGQVWIKNSTPNELSFTDDAGTDITGIGKYMYDVQRVGYYATATANYIPMTGYVVERTSTSGQNEFIGFIAPFNGTVHQVQWRSEAGQDGNTSFRILESADGTEVPGTMTGRKDETIDIDDDTTHTYDLSSMTSGDTDLVKGRIYALYISHPSSPYDTNVTVVFKWDITT